jgi:hypothetical protein
MGRVKAVSTHAGCRAQRREGSSTCMDSARCLQRLLLVNLAIRSSCMKCVSKLLCSTSLSICCWHCRALPAADLVNVILLTDLNIKALVPSCQHKIVSA